MNDNFNAICKRVRDWPGNKEAQVVGTDTYDRVTYVALAALRNNLGPEAIKAALEVEWPEGMSAQDQVRAMLGAAINKILEVDR